MDRKIAFGRVLREARKVTGLSQESFADAVEMDRTTISLLERGKQSPTVETVFRLCDVLRLSPSAMLARVEKAIARRAD